MAKTDKDRTVPEHGRPKRRKLRLFLLGGLFALTVVLLLAFAAAPRSWLLRKAAGGFLGARVGGSITSVAGTLRIKRLSLADNSGSGEVATLLLVDEIVLPWSPKPGDGRYFPELSITGPMITISDQPDRNYRFLDKLTAPGTPEKSNTSDGNAFSPLPFVPKTIRVRDLSFSHEQGGLNLHLYRMDMDATVDSLERFSLRAHGRGMHADWSLAGMVAARSPLGGGVSDFTLARNGGEWSANGSLDFGDAGMLEGTVKAVVSAEGGHAEGGILSGAFAPDPMPDSMLPRFTSLRLENLGFRYTGDNTGIQDLGMTGKIALDGLEAGPADAPWVRANLAVEGLETGNPEQLRFSATANDAPLGEIILQNSPGEGWGGRLTSTPLTPAALVRLIPAASAVPFPKTLKTFSLEVGNSPKAGGGAEIHAGITAQMGSGTAPVLGVRWSRDDENSWGRAELTVEAEGGTLNADCTINTGGARQTLGLAFNGVSPGWWLQTVAGLDMLAPLSLVLDGTGGVEWLVPSEARFEWKAAAPAPGWNGVKLSEEQTITTTGAIKYAGGRAAGNMELLLGEDSRLALSKLVYASDTGNASGEVSGTVALAPPAQLAGYPDVWGTLRIDKAAFKWLSGNELRLETLLLAFEGLGYGNWSLPYGMELTLSGPVWGTKAPFAAGAGPVDASLGGDTRLRFDKAAWNPEKMLLENLRLETGFAPLVSKGWLVSAEGNAAVSCSSLSYGPDQSAGTIEYSCEAASLVFPNGYGEIHGLDSTGSATVNNGLSGTGALKIESCKLPGMAAKDVTAGLRFEGMTARLEDLAMNLFGGAVNGAASVRLNEPGLPAEATLSVDGADLSVFTEEFKPPSVVLTGRLGGTLSIAAGLDGLRDFRLEMTASDGFSINKDLVEQLLVSQYMEGMSGGRQIGDVLRDVLGDQPQRPFDAGRADLRLEDGRIAGVIRLESKSLNLTVDVKADPAALLEALRIGRDSGAETTNTPPR